MEESACTKDIMEIFLVSQVHLYSSISLSRRLAESFGIHTYVQSLLLAVKSSLLSFWLCFLSASALPILAAAKLCILSFIRSQSLATACTVERAPCCHFPHAPFPSKNVDQFLGVCQWAAQSVLPTFVCKQSSYHDALYGNFYIEIRVCVFWRMMWFGLSLPARFPLPLHLSLAQNSPSMPTGQQGMGVPKVGILHRFQDEKSGRLSAGRNEYQICGYSHICGLT